MLYRGDIELLKNSLRIDQTYLISNAVVRPVKPGFENPLTNDKYQWILGARTAILATDEDALILSKLAPNFTHSDQFRDFLGKRTLISTAVIIIDSHPPRTVMAKGKENTLHEYAAVDELYNDAAPDDVYNLLSSTKERHIIAALKFSVSDYHNISLSSTSASVVLIKLCIHKERIDVLQQQGDVFRKAQTNFGHDTKTLTSIETLLTTEQEKFRFSLLVYDESGEIEVTVFGDEGEKLMQMSANDFMNQYCNNEPLRLDSINSNLHQLKLKMKIQSKVFNKQDGTTTMSHTMQTLECHQLASSASPAGISNVLELSASQKTKQPPFHQQQKHPSSDIHPNTSSRGRASTAKKTE
ncbi:hypothetical protein OROMI_003758 [Orobanche minor]